MVLTAVSVTSGIGLVAIGLQISRANAGQAAVSPAQVPAEPTDESAKQTRQKAQDRTIKNLKTIALAMHNVAAVEPGSPLSTGGHPQKRQAAVELRVAILPYLDHKPLYDKFHLDEPWDSAHNKTLLNQMPGVYAPVIRTDEPRVSTYYQVFTGHGALFEDELGPNAFRRQGRYVKYADGRGGRQFPCSGRSRRTFRSTGRKPLPKLGRQFDDGFHALFADGSIDFFRNDVSPGLLRALITSNGREIISHSRPRTLIRPVLQPGDSTPAQKAATRKLAARSRKITMESKVVKRIRSEIRAGVAIGLDPSNSPFEACDAHDRRGARRGDQGSTGARHRNRARSSTRWGACWPRTFGPTPTLRRSTRHSSTDTPCGPRIWKGSSPSLTIGELITAGRAPSRALGKGEAAVIMTGAPLPAGCDAVVMHERTRTCDGVVVIEQAAIKPGQNVLRRGAEMRAGEVVLSRGSVLHPAQLGVLASVGQDRSAGHTPAACLDRADRRRAGRARRNARGRVKSATRTRSCFAPWQANPERWRPRFRSRATSRTELARILEPGPRGRPGAGDRRGIRRPARSRAGYARSRWACARSSTRSI